MWVYWFTLASLSIILYFPCKSYFSKELALRISVATFILGISYPLIQAQLSFWQTLICLGLLVLFLGVTISRKHPHWDTSETTEIALSSPVSADTIDTGFSVDHEIAENDQPTIVPPEEQAPTEQHSENQDILMDTEENIVLPESEYIQSIEESGTALSEHQEIPLEELAATTSEALSKNIIQDEADVQLAETFSQVVGLEATSSQVIAAELPDTIECNDDELPQIEINNDMVSITTEPLFENSPAEIDFLQESPEDQTLDAKLTDNSTVVCDSEQLAEVPENSLEPSQSQVNTEVTPQYLLSEGLRLSKHKQYAQAVRYFNRLISCKPESEILYLAVSELSSLYQHLGLYPMASDIIKAFIEHPNLKNHPGLEHLIQKMKFIDCLTVLLKRDHYGQIPYEEVPEAVRREAFDNSLNIKRLIS